jgi:hypothetical protein
VTEAVKMFRAMTNGGRLKGLTRDDLYNGVKGILYSNLAAPQPPWSTPNVNRDCFFCKLPLGAGMTEMTACFHEFHQSCLRAWLTENVSCPLCFSKVSLPANGGPSFRQ